MTNKNNLHDNKDDGSSQPLNEVAPMSLAELLSARPAANAALLSDIFKVPPFPLPLSHLSVPDILQEAVDVAEETGRLFDENETCDGRRMATSRTRGRNEDRAADRTPRQ